MLGILSIGGQLSQQEQGAIVVLVSTYGPYSQDLYNQITSDYINGDPATVGQVQYYIGKQQTPFNAFNPLLIFGLAALVGFGVWYGNRN